MLAILQLKCCMKFFKNLLNFDFWQMIEDKAFEDFEPETSKDDEQYLRETLYKLIDYYHLNQTKNE